MIRKWKKTILHEAEELIIATLENETKNYEEPNIYQLAPLLKLDINNTTINIDVYLFVTKPRVDTSSRDPQWLESISFAVLKTQVKYDILQPFNIKQFEDAMKSTNFRVIDDSIKDTLTDEFKDKQKDLIINILSNHFSKYFEIFKKIQSSLSIFDF
ncbi:hypothetical protein [Lysinibacillus capsici]|uniref:hypothetical protein n=1 Tax=Lysinibacillus capsici TaxID=2115968 RepID=UPI00325FCE13